MGLSALPLTAHEVTKMAKELKIVCLDEDGNPYPEKKAKKKAAPKKKD